jgi:hypothetical protein
MNDNNSLPGCFGFYPKPLGANKCETCEYNQLCPKVVAKERLQPLVAKILEVEQILRGEKR